MNQQSIFRLALSGLVVSSAVVIACSGSAPSSPSASPQAVSDGQDGRVAAAAAGDVKTGSGAIEIIRLRMGVSGATPYAVFVDPGRTYGMNPGDAIELWTEWDPDLGLVPSVIPEDPKMTVDWGDGTIEDISCGPCKLTHTYRSPPGVFTVVLTLNDRHGTSVSRTFFLNSLPDASPPPVDTGTGTGTGIFT